MFFEQRICAMRRIAYRDGGFTLIEIMMAMLVFVTAVVILLGVYVGVASLRETSRNTGQAMADARAVLEAMRDASTTSLATVTGTDWTDWAANNGLTSLNDEVVTVTYENSLADPLDATVRIDWQEHQRDRSATVNTLLTKR